MEGIRESVRQVLIIVGVYWDSPCLGTELLELNVDGLLFHLWFGGQNKVALFNEPFHLVFSNNSPADWIFNSVVNVVEDWRIAFVDCDAVASRTGYHPTFAKPFDTDDGCTAHNGCQTC